MCPTISIETEKVKLARIQTSQSLTTTKQQSLKCLDLMNGSLVIISKISSHLKKNLLPLRKGKMVKKKLKKLHLLKKRII